MEKQSNNSARDAIFQSIRSHLVASNSLNRLEAEIHQSNHGAPVQRPVVLLDETTSLVGLFKENLEAVDGHCVVAQNELELVAALTEIINRLQQTNLRARSIAISDSPDVERLIRQVDAEVDELAVAPSASDIFAFDVGISRVQAGIAETGTLVLDSAVERHRLVSLVPPVHIAIIDASQIVGTLSEALALMYRDAKVSPIVTMVTGPSRTADIELTLAIGVHGPQELYVIVNNDLTK